MKAIIAISFNGLKKTPYVANAFLFQLDSGFIA
jgi:hypothetical protein